MLMGKNDTGEGKANYKGNKSDSTLKQHGGEGKHMQKGGSSSLLNPKSGYRGPGGSLRTQ